MPSSNPPFAAPDNPAAREPEPAAGRFRPWWHGFCLVVPGCVGFWAVRVVSEYTMDEQRSLAPVSTVWGMHACLFLGLVALACLAPALVRLVGRRNLLVALALAVLSYAACGLAPQTNRIFYDEHIYMQIGQTLAHTGRAEYASYARVEYGEFTAYEAALNKQPNGHPYLLSWAYRLAGASEGVSHLAVRVVVALTAALLFLALCIAPFKMPAATPLAASLGFIFTPLVLWWGRTVAVEPTTVAAAVAAFFAMCVHARWRDEKTGEGSPVSGLLLACTAAFAAYFRPESLLIYPVVAGLLWAADHRFVEDRTTWAALALSFALITPNLLQLWSVRTEDWGATDGRRFDIAFVVQNLRSNAGYFVQQKWFPLAGSLLAVSGLAWLAVRNRKLGAGIVLWFLLSWGVFVLFYAGGYHYGASSRYALVSAVPVALLMGIGAAAWCALLRRRPVALAVMGSLAGLNWVAAMSFVPTLGRESNEARADIDFCREAAALLPTGSLVISTDPCIWNMLGRNAAQLYTVEGMVRTEMRDLVRQYPGGVYLHWDYWMNTTPRFAAIWRQLILDTQATVFVRKNAEAVKFALFRLDTPHAIEAMGGRHPIPKPRIDMDDVIADTAAAAATPAPLPPPPPVGNPATPETPTP